MTMKSFESIKQREERMSKRTNRELRILDCAKTRSVKNQNQETIVIKNRGKREFFRIENGKIIEYDLSHLHNEPVELTGEEQATLKYWRP